MRAWKIWYLCIAILFLFTGIAGFFLLHTAPDAGLADVHTVSDLMELEVFLEWAEGDTGSASSLLQDFTKNKQAHIERATSADLVVLATATGNLDITGATYGQEILIDQVLQGSGISDGSACTVWNSYGLQVMDSKIVYRESLNLMQEGKQYLLFLSEPSLNAITKEKYYLLANSWFGYLPVPYTPNTPLPDRVRSKPYAQWANYPVFLTSSEIANARNEITQELLAYYGLY